MLRNGIRSGAGITALDRQRTRLDASLARLVVSHQHWVGALPVIERQRVAAHMREIEDGCKRLGLALAGIAEELSAESPDRERIRILSQAIGRQALACERELARAARTARDG